MLSQDKAPATWSKHQTEEGLSPLRFPHQAIHDCIKHVHLGRAWALEPSWEPLPKIRQLWDVHSKKDSFRNHVAGKNLCKNTHKLSSTFLDHWLFDKYPFWIQLPPLGSSGLSLPSFPPSSFAALPRKPPVPCHSKVKVSFLNKWACNKSHPI